MVSAHDVAAYILEHKRGPMTTMKLQKLVYYSQAWHLVWADEPLFDEEIQAWANGPVVYELFSAHRGKFSVESWPQGDSSKLEPYQQGTIDAVLDTYGDLSGRQLSALTHNEEPWRDARAGLGPTDKATTPITLDSLANYYSAVEQSDESLPVGELDWDSWR
ncbi:type II toxin-antitoxin system antitoxin SocA domain-containing protein [Cellulomonas sp. IC4_254]|uniref:Panacea domain-containing protein n=1 Tax=Cellulomonas sp. IC4_254 TaxID=2714040 RepID=UPI00141DACCD|nr:type II toxin-antitoxin system antitoxin SocA domain-containing protein [Cellulomonas sp. IC4_254]NHT18739.1 DUF4065 domain-containing protein [Cellulomonas sp. IC4_254]